MAYHIGKDAKPRTCQAKTSESCPLGGQHYETIEQTQVAILNSKLAGIFNQVAPATPVLNQLVKYTRYNKAIPSLTDGAVPFLDRIKELAGDTSADLEERDNRVEQARELLEAFLTEIDPNETVLTGTDFSYAKFRRELEAAQETADELIKDGSREDLEAFLEQRVNDRRFQEVLALQNSVQEEARILYKLYDIEDKLYRLEGEDEDGSYDAIRERGLEALKRWDQQLVIKNLGNQYKDLHSPLVARISELRRDEDIASGVWREYENSELAELQSVGEFKSGTREWLESRQSGIGGSDVGKILKVGDIDYREDEFREVLLSKTSPITDEQVEEQTGGHTEYTGYAGRGNAWEDYVVAEFSRNHPELNIAHCKTSWQDKENPFVRANFDGLMTDENGVPNGVLEIKTSSDPSKWGSEQAGIDGVPLQYRKQALWYARAAGFEKGAFGVMINDKEYREYHFQMTPELKAEAQRDFEQVQTFWKKTEKINNGTWVDASDDYAKGFADNALVTMGREGFSSRDSILSTLAAYKDVPLNEVKRDFDRRVYQNGVSKRESGNYDREATGSVREVLDTMFKEVDRTDPSMRPFVNIDLETSGSQPARGRIIDVGITISHPSKEDSKIKELDKLYGIPQNVLDAAGTGRQDIHHISPGMVSKQRSFHNQEEQKEVLDLLKKGTMVAHNALFETRWLRLHLAGFAEAEKRGEIKILDTMKTARWFVEPTPEWNSNRLEHFAGKFDIPYENAHRAKPDADMMALAVNRFAKALPTLPMLEPQARKKGEEKLREQGIIN